MKNKEVWPFVFLLGLLFFNWPLMDLFGSVLPYYLYSVWFLFILGIGLLATVKGRVEKDDHV
jgi:hypothetical protein